MSAATSMATARDGSWRRKLATTVGRQRYLLVALVCLVAAAPLLPRVHGGLAISALLTLSVVTGPAGLAPSRRSFLVSVVLAAVTWLSAWMAALAQAPFWLILSSFSATAFFGYLCVLLFSRHLLAGRSVTSETLIAAVNAYLALGLTFAFAFFALGVVDPGAFRGEALVGLPRERIGGFVYFSFVTLTTLGYGDVVPATPAAGMLASAEALTGQLYVALTIARVVGMYVARSSTPPD